MRNIAKSDKVGIAESARLLGVSRSTAYLMCRAGEIPGAELVAGVVWLAPRRAVMSAARKIAATQLSELEHAS
jgi:hypothetical protein